MPRPRRDGRPAREPVKHNFTDFYVRSLKPQEQPYRVYDKRQGGLVLQVQPTGSKRWKVYYSMRGQPRWYDIGAAEAVGLADARRLAAEVMLLVAMGRDPHAERMAQRGAGTFRELVETYLKECANKSVDQYERQLRGWAIPLWGNMSACAVTRADVKRLFGARKKDSPASAKLLLAAISSVYSWALHEDWSGVTVNPARGIASSRHDKTLVPRARERILSDDELPAFWRAWESAGLLRCQALRCVLLTGQRPGEIRHMRWQDIQEGEHTFERKVGGRIRTVTCSGGWWTLPGEPDGDWPGTKNGQGHVVWLTPAVLELLREASGDRREGFVFATARGRAVDDLDAAMRDASTALGVREPARPHDLRRTFASTVTRLGFGRDAMDRLLNHRTLGAVTATYDRFKYRTENMEAMEAVGRMVTTLISGQPRVLDFEGRKRVPA